jgi:cell division protein FtsQ
MEVRMATSKEKKTKSKHVGSGFVFSTLSFIVICAALVFGMSVFFRVANIKVSGADHYTESEIIEASGIKTGDNLMLINRESVQNRISSKLIYIGTVTVSRALPNTVLINVSESGTIACVGTDSGLWLIDKNCKLLEQSDTANAATYIQISGVSGVKPEKGSVMSVSQEDQPKKKCLNDLLCALTDNNMLTDVNSIDVSNVTNVEFKYMNRFTVKLGKDENFEYKFELLSGVVSKLESDKTGTIDLSQDKKAQFSPY